MAAPKIKLYVDVVSHFSYMSFYAVKVSCLALLLKRDTTEPMPELQLEYLHLNLSMDFSISRSLQWMLSPSWPPSFSTLQ